MTQGAILWSYALAPDVAVHVAGDRTLLRTATTETWIDGVAEQSLLVGLAGAIAGDAAGFAGDGQNRGAALLFRLDRLGLLTQCLTSRGVKLASRVPLRPPPVPVADQIPVGRLRLSPFAAIRPVNSSLSVEAPGAWAHVILHDRSLLPMLHDLALGHSAADIAAGLPGHALSAIREILSMLHQCGLLDRDAVSLWPHHDLLFHTRTRRGYARTSLGKAEIEPDLTELAVLAHGRTILPLPLPDAHRMNEEDPPFAQVSDRRRSIRRYGRLAITQAQLSEFLFRTLHDQGGRRPYPSGGACYPLCGYVAVDRCDGIARGLYAYDPAGHRLVGVADPCPDLDGLLSDAAASAGVADSPQVLLVLAARYDRTGGTYGDLAYSLILKEVGGVFQTAMLAAAAMGIGTCPLGTGNAALFGRITGQDPLIEAAVGEMMIGSIPDRS